MRHVRLFPVVGAFIPCAFSYNISQSSSNPYALVVTDGTNVIANNSAILIGAHNTTAQPIGSRPNATDLIDYRMITDTVAKIQVNSSRGFVGARFTTANPEAHFFGVWEYPWSQSITNKNVSYDLKGVGNSEGINWASVRAPFFITSEGYGVYADTRKMGSYNFSVPGQTQYIFNSSSLVYYIILPTEKGNYKSIIQQYTGLSAHSEMPPTSGLGPTFWSDDFEQDFHGSVSNAEENYYDVINHLDQYQIHASSMFADRPYGTGNRSFGNFDFDPKFYPNVENFIANLSSQRLDFQVWIANRAFLYTELYNTSSQNNWLFPGIDPVQFLGPALNLSIPQAYDYFEKKLEYFPSVGVKGYKIDRGEEEEMPVYEQNIQMGLFLKLAYETMVNKWGKSSFYNFARSAVDRDRAYTHIWNGDAHSNWTGLAYSVASGIRCGIISFSVWGSDTGGYVRDTGLVPSEELWARWMWFSAFSPVYEFMLGMNHTPWYPPYSNQTVNVLKKTANLHHDLLPFIKSYAKAASGNGVPIIRALFLEASTDDKIWEIADEYFFGSEFLVAPIVKSGGSREVYFPKIQGRDAKYLDYFDKATVHAAGFTAGVTATIDSSPVYVTQGAIIPRGDVYQGNNKWTSNWTPSLTIEAYPSFAVPETKFTYFDGEGDRGRTVSIWLGADKEQSRVRVAYEDLGANGTLVVYLKSGKKEVPLKSGGSEEVFEGVDTLF